MKILRSVVITLMGLTVALTLLGGVGTFCVAVGAEKYRSMLPLVPYKPLYQALAAVSLAAGVWGIPVTASLVRGGSTAYRNALLILLVGTLSAGIQTGVSQWVRGSSAPVNVRFFVTLFTLAVFLLLRLPPAREWVDFTHSPQGGDSKAASAGTALIVCGIVTLTTPVWAGPSHMSPDGHNWVTVLQRPLSVGGWGMVLVGAAMLLAVAKPVRNMIQPKNPPQSADDAATAHDNLLPGGLRQ